MRWRAQTDERRTAAPRLPGNRLGEIVRVLQLEDGDDTLFATHGLRARQGNHRGGVEIRVAPGFLITWRQHRHAEDRQVTAIAPSSPAGPS